MSKDDFQRRLERLQAQSPQKHAIPVQNAGQAKRSVSSPSGLRVGVGGAVFGFGAYTIRYTNQNYDALQASGGGSAIATYGLGGAALVVLGIILITRAVFTKSRQGPISDPRPKRQASATAIWITGLFGFFTGVISCFYLFWMAALRHVDTEAARSLEVGAVGLALILCLVALLFGLFSLIFRGRSLGRVFLYYWCGAILTFVTFKLADINLLKWQDLMAHAY